MSTSILVETIHNPRRYEAEQLKRARLIAELLGRGRLVLCEEPRS